MLWIIVRAELLDDRRGLAVVAVVVGDALVRMLQALMSGVRSPLPPRQVSASPVQ